MLHTHAVKDWNGSGAEVDHSTLTAQLEQGGLIRLSSLPFVLSDAEKALLTPSLLAPGKKNVSYDLSRDRLAGVIGDEATRKLMHGAIRRYAEQSGALLEALFPHYRGRLLDGRTSFRPAEIEGRVSSPKKDDTRLHVDAFPATPVQGKRLLRVFSNVNPNGRARHWRTGEPFADVAKHFATRLSPLSAAQRRLMQAVKITKSYRTAYDDLMLQIHDAMKLDPSYQSGVNAEHIHFQPGETWIVFTDSVSHAAHSGQFLMEQTFYLPADAMLNPEQSPLRQLEKLKGRALLN
jgi:hypothetical protein